jgi:hypothetical protein
MIRKTSWVLIFILAVLLGFFFYVKDRNAKIAAQATPTPGTKYLFDQSLGAPTDIKIMDISANTVEVARDTSGTWVLKAPTSAAADQGSVEAAATQVSALRILNDVQLGPSIVGLDKPSYVISLTFSNNQKHQLAVGSVTPIQDGYYAQLDAGKIQIVDKQGLDALVGLLTTPPYAATQTPSVSATPTNPPVTPTTEPTLTPATTPVVVTPTGTP